jgi:hypothetical protein
VSFEGVDVLADDGLGAAPLARGGREAAGVDHADEGFHLVEAIHCL